MHFEFDEQGYVCCILYGCESGSCVEYTGLVPTQPEEYADMDDWADRAKTQAYKLNAEGNLVYDEARAATLPNEDDVVLQPYSEEQLKALGIADAIQAAIKAATPPFDTIYPVGSLYISMNSTNPSEFFGGTWEQIQDTFLIAAGTSYSAGSTGGSATHSHFAPVGFNSLGYFGISYAAGEGSTAFDGKYVTTGQAVTSGTGYFEWMLPQTNPESNIPPYLAVYVWQRTA